MCHAPRASSSRMSRLPAALILLVLILIRESRQQLETTTDQRIIYRGVVNITLADTRNQEAFMQQMHIAPESNLVCNIIHIPTRIAFLIFQIHVHEYNVTLSYDEANNDKGKSVFGSNIGLFFDARSNAPKTVYLRNQNVHSVDALLVITVYGDGAPIPGGCNMEFETEVAPYMKLKAENGLIMIDMQPASLSALTYPPKFTCGKSGIKHTVYQMFLPEYDFSTDSYFSAIQTMMTVENIVKNGRKMTPGCNTPMRRVHSAYVGVGSVYVAVSQYKNYSSAFVPTFSYACSPLLYPESCRMLYGIMPKIVCFFALCLGIGTVFGSRNRSYIPIFSIGCVIGYASAKGSMSLEISLLLAIVAGILAIGLEYCVSAMCKREPSDDHGENVLVFLIAGTLLASATYLHLPDALQFSNDFAFWLLFFSLIFFFILLIMGLNFMRLPLSTTIFGTSLIVLSIDYYTSSCLKYILINIIRRATVTDFDLATVDPPYQTADIWMTVLWCCLGVVGLWKLAPDNSDPVSRFTEIMSRFPRDPREPRTPREPRIPREPRTPREPRFPRNLIYTHYAPSAPNYHSFPQYSFD